MEGISKKRLEEIAEDYPPDHRNHRMAKYLIATECQELQEPWMPIDENTPQNRPLWLLYAADEIFRKRYEAAYYDPNKEGRKPTHYQELPDDPETGDKNARN